MRIDTELFISTLSDFSDLIYEDQENDGTKTINYYRYQDIEYKATQTGASFSLGYKPSPKLHTKLYGTFYTYDFEAENEDIANEPFSVNESTTPDFYGGFTVRYIPVNNLMMHADAYFMSHQSFTGLTGKQQIPSTTVINVKASYTLFEGFKPFVSMRNLLGDHREYGFADTIGRTYIFGFQYEH